MKDLQSKAELEQFWQKPDPWAYQTTGDDRARVGELLAALPRRPYSRTLDIGCGDGFVTFELPGDEITGVDISEAAIAWAQKSAAGRADKHRFRFLAGSVFDLPRLDLGRFDLVVISGLLYPEYIGRAFATIECSVHELLAPDAILCSAHDAKKTYAQFALLRLLQQRLVYRGSELVLEVYQA